MQKLMWTLVLVLSSSMAAAADIPQLVGEVQVLKAKATGIKADISKESAKKEAAGKAIGKINRQLAPVQATIKALQGLTTPLDATQQALLTASLAQEAALTQDLADEVQERDDAQKAIDQAQKDLDDTLNERSDKQDELSLLTSSAVHTTNEGLTTLRRDLDTHVSTLTNKIGAVETKVDELTSSFNQFRTDLAADLDRRFDKLSQEQSDQLTKFLNSVDEKLKAATSKEEIAAIKAMTQRVLDLTEKKIKQDKKTKYVYTPPATTNTTATSTTSTTSPTVYYFPQYNNGYTYSYPYTYSYCGSYPYYYSGRYWSYRWWW